MKSLIKTKIQELAVQAWDDVGATTDPLEQSYRQGVHIALRQSVSVPPRILRRLAQAAPIEAKRQWREGRNPWKHSYWMGLRDGYTEALGFYLDRSH